MMGTKAAHAASSPTEEQQTMARTRYSFIAVISQDGNVVSRRKVSVDATTEDGARRLIVARLVSLYGSGTVVLTRTDA